MSKLSINTYFIFELLLLLLKKVFINPDQTKLFYEATH